MLMPWPGFGSHSAKFHIYVPITAHLRLVFPTVNWVLLHHLAIKMMAHRHATAQSTRGNQRIKRLMSYCGRCCVSGDAVGMVPVFNRL